MCGIAGRISWVTPPEDAQIKTMTRRLWHRGPDAGGTFLEGPAGLGHRRLAVIDVHAAANQPMLDPGGRFVIVFNGEIYNYRGLRTELERQGAKFITDSDTEVLLEAYKAWGADCLARLNGMFAFAVWDRKAQRLFLARDRLGKKPLYYYLLPDGGIVFASELKALRCDRDVPSALNPRALGHYLCLNYILTSECILEGVRKLAPAHYLVIERGAPPRLVQYWDLADKFRTKRHFPADRAAAEELAALIDDAVRLRLVSDVPLGAFLSGGLDSSTIVASMCHVGETRATDTFSAGFHESSYSELPWARRVARSLGVQHRDTTVSPDIAGEIEHIVYYADEPFADSSLIPTYALARFARRFVTVCLSGDGGDELFAGYPTYLADKLHRAGRLAPAWLRAASQAAAERLLPVTRRKVSLDSRIRRFLKGLQLPTLAAHYSWRTIFTPEEAINVLDPDLSVAEADPSSEFARYQGELSDCHYLDQAMYVDLKTWLPDDILVKVDRATMAHSLEARAPLLDYRVVEFAASLPVDLKLRRLQSKYILKQSQRGRLPYRVIHRSKRGFNAPVSHWVSTSFRGVFDELLTDPKTKSCFNRRYIEQLRAEHDQGAADHGLKLFGILCLGLWIRQS